MCLNNGIWQKIFEQREDIAIRKIAGEMFLVPIRGKLADLQTIYAVNPVAEYIWRHLDGKNRLIEIHKGVLNDFSVERVEEVSAEIHNYMVELLKAGLIVEVN